jgi:predicted GIY-YIG superfamily endonuclease
MHSGIYKIINKINGKYYIGSSKSINDRWKVRRCQIHTTLKGRCLPGSNAYA